MQPGPTRAKGRKIKEGGKNIKQREKIKGEGLGTSLARGILKG